MTKIIIGLTLVLLISISCQNKVRQLNDKNFEHDTQATTGSTTGDWFVNFCDVKNKDCRQILPLWEELSERLYGRLSVAYVELGKNPELQRRLGIRYVPYLALFRKGKYYEYRGEFDLELLHQFAIDTYEKAANQGDIPIEPSALKKLWKMMLNEIDEQGGLLNTILMKDDQGNINYQAVIIIYALPILTLVSVCYICVKSDNTEPQKQGGQKPSNQKKITEQQQQQQKNKKNQ